MNIFKLRELFRIRIRLTEQDIINRRTGVFRLKEVGQMRIGRLAAALGISGVILIAAAAYGCNQEGMTDWQGAAWHRDAPPAYSLHNQRSVLGKWPAVRIILRSENQWVPDSMKALIRRLGNV